MRSIGYIVIVGVVAAAALVAGARPCASAVAVPTAGQLADRCKLSLQSEPPPLAVAACTFVIQGYMAGFRDGATRGLRTAFVDDPQNLQTTKGVEDVTGRIDALRPKAQCVERSATIEQVTATFIVYVDSHPAERSLPYSQALENAFEAYFCGARQ